MTESDLQLLSTYTCMTERAASWILLIVPLLALAVLGRADEPPPASSDWPSESQETMSKVMGRTSYPITQGVGVIPFARQG